MQIGKTGFRKRFVAGPELKIKIPGKCINPLLSYMRLEKKHVVLLQGCVKNVSLRNPSLPIDQYYAIVNS